MHKLIEKGIGALCGRGFFIPFWKWLKISTMVDFIIMARRLYCEKCQNHVLLFFLFCNFLFVFPLRKKMSFFTRPQTTAVPIVGDWSAAAGANVATGNGRHQSRKSNIHRPPQTADHGQSSLNRNDSWFQLVTAFLARFHCRILASINWLKITTGPWRLHNDWHHVALSLSWLHPSDVRLCQSVITFKRHLKTHLSTNRLP